MDIESLAAKLRPLVPDEVARWMRIRESADPETAHLIEEQIRATARRLLGDTENQVLLSLPPLNLVRGPINVGKIQYAGERGPAGISTSDVLQNLAIFGRSGAGKTNAVFHILKQLADQGVPFLFLDWKRTARHWAPTLKPRPVTYTAGRPIAPLVFNPFVPPPALEPSTYIGILVDVLADAYDLGDGAISVLQDAINTCYSECNLAPTAAQILDGIHRKANTGRALGWTASASRALRSIDFAGLASGERVTQEELTRRFLEQSTIIELDGLSAASKQFLIPMLCLWVYYQQLASEQREQLKLVIVVEEAHHVLLREQRRAKESVMSMLLRQCREIGIGMIVVDQHPHLISSAALGNTAVTLVMNLKDPADVAKAAGLCNIQDAGKSCFTMLPVGEAVVKLQERYRRPFLIRMPHIEVDKGRVNDAWVRELNSGTRNIGPSFARSAGSGPSVPGSAGPGRVRASVEALDEQALRLLADVCSHPDDGVRDRYRRLGLSGDRGHRLKLSLLVGGWVEQQMVGIGNTRKAILRPSQAAMSLVGVATSAPGDGSIAHAYWQRWYAKELSDAGYEVELEAKRRGGRVDILARRGKELLGVEIETGKSDVLANVKRCLRSGLSRVLVVCTDGRALKSVERRLATAGLMVPGRVQVVTAPNVTTFTAPAADS